VTLICSMEQHWQKLAHLWMTNFELICQGGDSSFALRTGSCDELEPHLGVAYLGKATLQ
jgi:hypothetical protein